MGKNGWLLLTHLKPRAEGYETEILTKFTLRYPINHIACMWKPQTFNTITVWVIVSDESRARRLATAIFHGTSPQGEQSSTVGSRRSANGWIASEIYYFWARKSQQRRAMWPLREGREIWGVDGAFASISWHRDCVRDGVAPSANELAWFYKGFRHRSRRRRSQSVKSSRSVEWTYDREHETHGIRTFVRQSGSLARYMTWQTTSCPVLFRSHSACVPRMRLWVLQIYRCEFGYRMRLSRPQITELCVNLTV